MKESPIPATIDLHNPHRSLLGRIIEASPRPKKTELSSMKYVDALAPNVRAAGDFLLDCIHDTAELNTMGHFMVQNLFAEILQNHYQINERFRMQQFNPVEAPVFILGLPRTGSTYLFNLLGATDYFRTMRHWETLKIASRKPDFLKRFEAALALKMMHQLSPGFRTVHEIRLDGPEECTRPLLSCFVSQPLPGIFHIPHYNEYLDTADYLPTYEFFHKQLQVMGSQNKRWLLKSPIHLQSVDSILKVFPDARFIHLHRDFEEVVCSICSLTAAYRCMTSYRHIGPEIGSEVRKYLTRDLEKGQAVLDANKEKVLDLHYKQIVDHPVETVKEVFSFVGAEYDDTIDRSIRNEMSVSIPNKYGKHIYYEEDYFPSHDSIHADVRETG
jgi:hypothetical protein